MIPSGVFLCTNISVAVLVRTGKPDPYTWIYTFKGSSHEDRVTHAGSSVQLYEAPGRYEVGKRYAFQFSNITPD